MSADALRMRCRRLCERKPSGKYNVDAEVAKQHKEGGATRECLEMALLEAIARHGTDRRQYKRIKAHCGFAWWNHLQYMHAIVNIYSDIVNIFKKSIYNHVVTIFPDSHILSPQCLSLLRRPNSWQRSAWSRRGCNQENRKPWASGWQRMLCGKARSGLLLLYEASYSIVASSQRAWPG